MNKTEALSRYKDAILRLDELDRARALLKREIVNMQAYLTGVTLPPTSIPTSPNGFSKRSPKGSAVKLVLEALSSGYKTLQELGQVTGLPTGSVSGGLHRLIQQHLVRRTGRSQYELMVHKDKDRD